MNHFYGPHRQQKQTEIFGRLVELSGFEPVVFVFKGECQSQCTLLCGLKNGFLGLVYGFIKKLPKQLMKFFKKLPKF
jgi:hypothetical protein